MPTTTPNNDSNDTWNLVGFEMFKLSIYVLLIFLFLRFVHPEWFQTTVLSSIQGTFSRTIGSAAFETALILAVIPFIVTEVSWCTSFTNCRIIDANNSSLSPGAGFGTFFGGLILLVGTYVIVRRM